MCVYVYIYITYSVCIKYVCTHARMSDTCYISVYIYICMYTHPYTYIYIHAYIHERATRGLQCSVIFPLGLSLSSLFNTK